MMYFKLYLLIINLYGFFIMYYDKKKAINKKWRISEATLFTIALAFGSLGILGGMYVFRHKTKHKRFTILIPIILIIQVYILIRFIKI